MGGSKQEQRASELANTVYAGVKQKMGAMKTELVALREESTRLRGALEEKGVEVEKASERAEAEAEAKIAHAKAQSEATVSKHLQFIDRLLADKAELSKQCEGLTDKMRSLEERFAAAEAKREEAYAKELRKQKEVWATAEKAKREQWLAEKTREIKEQTVRGLEPDIQRLVARHRDETKKMEESLREEHTAELVSERNKQQRELARMQEAGLAERHAAQERERELCQGRLQEMSLHFEEQLRVQRQRQASAAAQELEERDGARRREIGRLEEELRQAKGREEAAASAARDERSELHERLAREGAERIERERKAHAAARAEWEAAFEAEVSRKVEAEKASIEAASMASRDEKVAVVVKKLGAEMALAEQKWQAKLDAAGRAADARLAEALDKAGGETDDVRSKYVSTVELQSRLESRLRGVVEELAEAKEQAKAHAAEAERARAEAYATVRDAQEERRKATLSLTTELAQAQGERGAMGEELTALRAEQRALLTAHAEALAEARGLKEGELAAVEERVRGLSARKDETISTLQAQVGALQGELHTAREQLHATQQEILSFQ